MTSVGRARLSFGCAAALALACASCGEEERTWIERARGESAAADHAVEVGKPSEAMRLLRAIAEREAPPSVAEEDARVVRQDAYDRWAQLALSGGRIEESQRIVERGLALGERQDVFTANLLTTRGKIHEARGRDREAARDYHRALGIEEALLERALGGDDEP
jgi:hypothetical protein